MTKQSHSKPGLFMNSHVLTMTFIDLGYKIVMTIIVHGYELAMTFTDYSHHLTMTIIDNGHELTMTFIDHVHITCQDLYRTLLFTITARPGSFMNLP